MTKPKHIVRHVTCRRCGKKSRPFQIRPYFKNVPKGWYCSDQLGRWFCGPCESAMTVRLLKQLGSLCQESGVPIIDIGTGKRLA